MVAWRRLLITAFVLIFSACGGDTDETPPVTETDTSTSVDGEAGVCENPCLNEFGKNDKKLCPDPKSEWTCTGGCCIPVFKCATDEDCADQGFAEGQCTEERFGCRCETASGVCFPWYCAVDSECGEGESCDGGSCVEGPSADALAPRILGGPRVLTPEATGQMVADAWDSATGLASPETAVQWSSDAPDVVEVSETGEATGGDTAGEATLTGKVGDKEATWTVRNIVPDPSATVTVIAIVAGTSDPVAGEYAAVNGESGELLASGPIPADGVIEATTDGAGGVDVHLFGQGTDWVSWLRGDGVVLLPVPRTAWGEISLDPADEVQAEGTELEGMNIVSGEVDFGDYPKQGELELTLSSFPLGNGLFDFSLETLLGPEVSRYFDPGHSLPGVDTDEVAQIPGGLTFSLSTPAILTYQLGAQPGDRRVWTVGGRISLEEISEYADLLFAAFDDGLDFNLLVGTLFPTFADFWSAVTPVSEVPGDGSLDATKAPVTLAFPSPLRTLVTPSDLPPLVRDEDVPGLCSGEGGTSCSGDEDCPEESTCEGAKAAGSLGWANALFLLNGAITGDALMVPLGINAGSDTSDPELNPEDGVA
ncbi:MAG: hypothetical protein VX938_10810, partial [Myxococcota bacterium]|nr:hypothetical protein [Myxococcota bacterium]